MVCAQYALPEGADGKAAHAMLASKGDPVSTAESRAARLASEGCASPIKIEWPASSVDPGSLVVGDSSSSQRLLRAPHAHTPTIKNAKGQRRELPTLYDDATKDKSPAAKMGEATTCDRPHVSLLRPVCCVIARES
jgi:hypothetical protein